MSFLFILNKPNNINNYVNNNNFMTFNNKSLFVQN